MAVPKNVTCFFHKDQAEEAARFYTEIFPDGKITRITRTPPGLRMQEGVVLTVEFTMMGQNYVTLNGGGAVHYTEAVSIQVLCETQEEVDRYWEALQADGGKPVECGWLKDKYGMAWQIVPVRLLDMISDADPVRASRAMKAMMTMVKLDIAALDKAYAG